MNDFRNDIVLSKEYLLSLDVDAKHINLTSQNLELLNMLANVIVNEVVDNIAYNIFANKSILLTIKQLSYPDQATLKFIVAKKIFPKENESENFIAPDAFVKNKSVGFSNEITSVSDIDFEKIIVTAFKKSKRLELKEKLRSLEFSLENEKLAVNYNLEIPSKFTFKNKKDFNLFRYFKIVSVAAILVVVFIIWQPNKTSNRKLFAEYTSGSVDIPPIDVNQLTNRSQLSYVRGKEFLFNNYTSDESDELLKAIEMINAGNFFPAKKIFYKLSVSKEKSPELLIYLSIAQLHTNEIDSAISNLEYLLNKIRSASILSQEELINNQINNPPVLSKTDKRLSVIGIDIGREFTKIDFVIHASQDFENGGWISIEPDCFIRITGSEKNLYLTKAVGIPIEPKRHYYKSNNDSLNYSLYFPPIPVNARYLDIIDHEGIGDSSKIYFNFYQVELPMIKREISFIPFEDDIKFHLAMGYIKTNKLKEAKSLLKSLVENNSMYSNEANLFLSKIRWF